MNSQQIHEIIQQTVDITILKLKAAGILKDNAKSAYEKTEALLYQYNDLVKVNQPYAQKVVAEIDACIADIANEPYKDVIRLYYFESLTNAACASVLGCEERTARRNRKAYVEKFSSRLASDEFIRELLL